MTHRVLVAYASKHGSTAEIARRIGSVLSSAGLATDVRSLDNDVFALSDYTAVILGSAVYAGQWQKSAADFLQAQQHALTNRPTWLFSSGPTGEGDPVELLRGWRFPSALLPVADVIRPREIVVFSGEIDPSQLNFAEKLIVRGVKAATGDFRDWESITQWAESVATVLQPQHAP
jgi:menaquinone-dependent protoporphyrinogen oxidase